MTIERSLPVDEARIKKTIDLALSARDRKDLFFSNKIIPPEMPFINIIVDHGKKTQQETFAVNALFLSTSFVFGDRTSSLFGRISDKRKLERFDWLFIPNTALSYPDEVINLALMQYFEPAGYNSNVIPQWKHNLEILKNKYGGDIRNFFRENDDDAIKIVKALYVRNRAKTPEKNNSFRRYGPKLAHLAVQWISQYELYDFKNIDVSGLPIDFQVARIFIQTNGLILTKPESVDTVVYKTLLPKLVEICSKNNIDPRRVSETLWIIGSSLCNKRRHGECPLQNICTSMISSNLYQQKGVFDPKDIGRYATKKIKKSSL